MSTLSLPPRASQVGLAVDVAAFAIHEGQLKVLLVQRGTRPHNEAWALPGGFVQSQEALEHAALRVLREETGVSLEPNHLEQLRAFGEPDRDPRGRIVSVTHLAVLPHGAPEVAGGYGATDAAWCGAHDPLVLAFDHADILAHALRRVSIRLEFAYLALEFLPETFTLPELQEVYEAILAKKLDKRNFRKRILSGDALEGAGERRVGVGRPAQLYKRSKRLRLPML